MTSNNNSLPSTDNLLAGIRQLVEMESYTHDHQSKAQLCAFLLLQYQKAGFPVETITSEIDTPHILARSPWGGSGKGILLLSHYDTVHPTGTLKDFPFSINGNHAYGPGILDMKAGLHLAMRVLEELAASGATDGLLPVTHLITSDEEHCSTSSRALIQREAERARYVIVTEPQGQPGCVTTARKGSLRYKFHIVGRAAHSGSHHQDGRNAILEAAHQIIALEALTDYERGLTVNCGLISGGIGVNTIPENCEFDVDVRFFDADIVDYMDTVIGSLQPHTPDVRLDIAGRLNRPAFSRLEKADALIRQIQSAARTCGFDLAEFQSGGGSDANLTCQIAPTVCGMGAEGADAHTLQERLDIPSLVPRYALLRETLQSLS